MSSPLTPQKTPISKRSQISLGFKLQEDNNNTSTLKCSERLQARNFITWFKGLIDNERQNLILYLADDVVLEWFGRTIRTRKKVSAFLRYDMQCSRHDFRSIDSIESIQTRLDRAPRRLPISESSSLASPLHSPEIVKSGKRCGSDNKKRSAIPYRCKSPEWETEEHRVLEKKRLKTDDHDVINVGKTLQNGDDIVTNKGDGLSVFEKKRLKTEDHHNDINIRKELQNKDDIVTNKGDGLLGKAGKRKCVQVTPPNRELGQGDCLPSTSGTDSELSHAALNSQLPRKAVECNGFIEFMRTRNSRSVDAMKWERKCKVQICYSEDPLNVGEYIIWALHYTDESKCRRNLLAAFEEVAKEDALKK